MLGENLFLPGVLLPQYSTLEQIQLDTQSFKFTIQK